MTIATRRFAVPDLGAIGSTALLALSVAFGTTLLPWYQLVAFDTLVNQEGSGLFGVLALLCAIATTVLVLTNRHFGTHWPRLPFKRTSFAVVFALLALGCVGAALLIGRDVGGLSYENAIGTQVALVAVLVLVAATVIDVVADPDPFVS